MIIRLYLQYFVAIVPHDLVICDFIQKACAPKTS
jgi:hypothetical protein